MWYYYLTRVLTSVCWYLSSSEERLMVIWASNMPQTCLLVVLLVMLVSVVVEILSYFLLTHCGLGDFIWVLFRPITVIDGWDTCCEITLRRMSLDLTDDKSTLVQVMAWCHQAASHYLSQCWPRFMSPYGVTRPQWVKCCSVLFFWFINDECLV